MSDVAKPAKKYESFAEFYPFYLSEHSDRTCRRLHFAGSTLALLCLVALVVTRNPWWLLAGLVCGYGFAWVGHFAFEKNQPASFRQPLEDVLADRDGEDRVLSHKCRSGARHRSRVYPRSASINTQVATADLGGASPESIATTISMSLRQSSVL